jgi:hypothetical protein
MSPNIMMIKFNLQPIPLDRFHWEKDLGRISAEASDFSDMSDRLKKQYLAVESRKTKTIHIFKLSETVKDSTGEDIYYWMYKPITKYCPLEKLILWND